MWPVFPTSDYYGASVPSRPISRQRACPSPTWPAGVRAEPGWFPRSPCSVRPVRRPAVPLQHRNDYAAGLRRGLTTGTINRLRSRPRRQPTARACTALRPISARFEPMELLRSFSTGSSRTPSGHACRTRAVWQYQPVPSLSGLLPSSPALPGSDCPQLHRPAATGQRRSPFISARCHGASWRTMV